MNPPTDSFEEPSLLIPALYAIKASYSNYSYSSVDKKYIIDNCGVLCKCPRPSSDSASILYNTPIYSLSYIYQDIIVSLFHLLSSNSLIDGSYISSSSIASQAMREQHRHRDKGNSFHSSHDSFHSCLNKTPSPGTTNLDPTGDSLTEPLSSLPSTSSLPGIISMSTHLDSGQDKKGEKVENPNERTVIFGTKYFREYYKKHHKIPSLCEFRRAYRNSPYATGAETEENRKRIKKNYNYLKQGFNPEELNKSKYIVGEYINEIKKCITEEHARIIARSRSSYNRKIYYEDIDMATGYYFKNLTEKVDEKYNNNKSLTVPANNLCDGIKSRD